MAESITEGTLKGWSVSEGDYVEQDQEIGSIETDKIDVAINAPTAGTIKKFLANEEDTVAVGQDLIVMELGGEPGQKAEKASEKPKEPASDSQQTSSQPQGGKEQEAPSKPDPPKQESKPEPPKQESKPEPPKQESETPKQQEQPKKDSKPQSPKQESSGEQPYGSREERRVKMNRMRLRIAERLKQSQNTAASLTTFNEVDMSALMDMRKSYKDEILKKTGVKLGFMSAFSMASCLAMKEVPSVNASIEGPGGGDTIVYRDYVDISVAVSTEKGLVTPVVRNAESMDMVGIEKAISDLGKKVCCPHCLPLPSLGAFSIEIKLLTLSCATPGPRQQTHHRGHGRRDLHHQQRRRLRLAHGHTHHQPAADRRAGPARHQGEARRHQRQGRDPAYDVPRADVRSSVVGWKGGGDVLGQD